MERAKDRWLYSNDHCLFGLDQRERELITYLTAQLNICDLVHLSDVIVRIVELLH